MAGVKPTDPRLAVEAIDELTRIVAAGLGQEGLALLAEALDEAREILQTGEDPGLLDQALERATDVAMRDPEVARVYDRPTMLDRLRRWVSLQVTPEYPWSSPWHLLRGLPGMPGPLRVWTVTSESVAGRLRAEIEPGQVWVRVDGLADDEWRPLRSHAQYGRRMLGETFAGAGRRTGARARSRRPLIEAIRSQPTMTTDEIERVAWDTDLWSGMSEEPRHVQRRVAALRRDAGVTAPAVGRPRKVREADG